MPFKIFVATAGALEYPRWKFLVTVMLARAFRYYVEGILAVFYGRRVLAFMLDNGLVIITICGTVAVVLVLIFALFNRRNEQATGDPTAAVQTDESDDKTLSE
jgi:membrane protein DedA with SNARE-associated domain